MNTNIPIVSEDRAMALHQAEIDTQIATAKQYPRDLGLFQDRCKQMIAINPEMAESCFYVLTRKAKDGKQVEIRGPSIRMAEIVMANWGNLRVGAKVLEEGQDFILIEAACHDLESNNAISVQVKRRITTAKGQRYGADMIQTTTAATISIGMRNAIFKIIPNIFVQEYLKLAQNAAQGPKDTFAGRVQRAFAYFADLGVSEDRILDRLKIKKKTQVSGDHLTILQGIRTAMRDGQTTIAQEFGAGLRAPHASGTGPGTVSEAGQDETGSEGPQNAPGEVEDFDETDEGEEDLIV